MYSPVRIETLSPAQVARLLSGSTVRIKLSPSGAQVINVSQEQKKKLSKAAMKGSGLNMTFDPYQMDYHRQTIGQGINWGKIGKALKGIVTSDIGKKAQKFLVDKAFDVLPLPKGVEDVGRKLAYKGIEAQGLEAGLMPPTSKPKRKRTAKKKAPTNPFKVPQYVNIRQYKAPVKPRSKKTDGGAMYPAGYF